MHANRDSHGFSMIEVIVALALVGILAVIAVPSFVSYMQLNRLQEATQQLYFNLQNARSEAIKRSTTVYVSFVSGTSWCYGWNTGATCNCATAGNCNLGTVSSPSTKQLTLSATGLTSNALKFENTHGASYSASTLTFTLNSGTTAMSVEVSLLGDLKICSNQVTGYQSCP